MGGQKKPGNASRQERAAGGQNVAAVEYGRCHVNPLLLSPPERSDAESNAAATKIQLSWASVTNNGYVNRCSGRAINIIDKALALAPVAWRRAP
jgi:hypothetical protein